MRHVTLLIRVTNDRTIYSNKDLGAKRGTNAMRRGGMETIISPCACLYVKFITLCLCSHIFINYVFLLLQTSVKNIQNITMCSVCVDNDGTLTSTLKLLLIHLG